MEIKSANIKGLWWYPTSTLCIRVYICACESESESERSSSHSVSWDIIQMCVVMYQVMKCY